ncbi:hypothetical protein O181_056206 [Austropuccinia psidii MF-1]|uniref:Reverse transcriptase domain-containing protein n=1 Tax=Austropuccinia psidii MF-1 TaxID=1389203 RepID=A0A9Q3HSQ7_9BASI|nr:hypothetical protein [Austropuccinia psidii MF-1]
MGIYEYTRRPFGIKNAPPHFKWMMDKIFQDKIPEGWMVVYIDDIIIYSEKWEDHVKYIDRVLSKCTPINLKISLKKCNYGQQELLALGHKVSGLSLYSRNHIKDFAHIACSLYRLCSKDVVFEITKERRDAYERIKHELTNAPVLMFPDFELPFKLYIDTACNQGSGAALHKRQIVDGAPREGVICYISRQLKDSEARYVATQTEYGLSRWPLDNKKRNPAYEPETEAKIPIHFMEIDRKKNFTFSEWAAQSGTLESGNTYSEGTETLILGIRSSELQNEFFSAVLKSYAEYKQCGILLQFLQQKYGSPELESQLEEPWLKAYRDHISLLLQEFHDCPYMGHMSEDETKETVASTALWPKWEQELSEYLNTCERCQKANKKHGKKYGLFQHIEEPKLSG